MSGSIPYLVCVPLASVVLFILASLRYSVSGAFASVAFGLPIFYTVDYNLVARKTGLSNTAVDNFTFGLLATNLILFIVWTLLLLRRSYRQKNENLLWFTAMPIVLSPVVWTFGIIAFGSID